jgi:pimeloyl-ACP methyl ester carboxylesterase
VTCGKYKSCSRVDNASTVIQGTWKELGTTGATGFVASDHSAKVNVLAIRGSVSAANWATDGRYKQVECPEYGGKGSKCNDGYYAVWSDCKKQAVAAMAKAISAYPDYKLVVTGHSLGATTAVYAVADLRNIGKSATLVGHQ